MLSILIPTYNFNSYPLVSQLVDQAHKANIDFEVICIDDGSKSHLNKENQKINDIPNCKFIALEKNVGLSKTRNILAKESKYETFIFIDGDSILPDKEFVVRYVNALTEITDVIYGGRIHPKSIDSDKKLRWKYGLFREDLKASARKKNPYKCTLFNNTLIKKNVFNTIKFEEKITQYGHEDTLFAYQLSKLKANIFHIDNPVLHNDIDPNEIFISKTEKSLKNLNSIYRSNLINTNFVTLLRLYKTLKIIGLHYIFALNYRLFHNIYRKQLTSKTPYLFIFSLFKLSYFCNINLKKCHLFFLL